MKLLGVLLQSKKGDPLIISSAPSLHTRTIILYSNMIYANILDSYRSRREKIERCILLECNLQCVLTITKDYIFYVYVAKSELGLAFDAIRKVTEYFNSSQLKIFQGAKTGQAKLDIVGKRFVQFMSFFEEFLYTREFPIPRQRQIFSLAPAQQSTKKKLDFEIFNKFSHITNQNDKIIILEMAKSYNKVAGLEVKKKMKTIEHMKKYSIKNKDQLELLDIDPQKEDFINSYRKNLVRFAYCNKPIQHHLYSQKPASQKAIVSQGNFIIQQQMLEQPVIQKERIKVKMMQKLQLHLFQGKIKQVIQFGQIIVQGTQPQTATISLLTPQQYWTNPKILNKRTSPNSLTITQLSPSQYQFTTTPEYKSKPVIDYIIRKETFTPEKIPLLFVYTMESSPSNIQFVFKYKINEKWAEALMDVEIAVHLNPDFVISGDFRSIPMAVSLRNHKIIWKTKEISHSAAAKGKILLAFTSSNVPAKSIIKEIKLSMKCHNKCMLQGLNAECVQQDSQTTRAQKTLLIQYKVMPNE